jgi:cellulose synthase/poly-beta-1,6-N-acetylglucosamine synthase-like glycosyltransferase
MQFLPNYQDTFLFYLFWTFASLAGIQLVYVVLFFGRLAFYKKKNDKHLFPPVSVVIAARNESDNLYENLPKLLEQDYPAPFEVVVVNHQSIDDSKYLLDALQRQYPNLAVMDVERSRHLPASKKFPLTMGIKKAKYDHLVLTDADCSPASNLWLQKMTNKFSEKHQIVLGYGPYNKTKGFLNKLIRFDTTMIAVHYFSMAINKIPYMGVGRNLAYTKDVFKSTSGFKSHISLMSGDDDLFIQEAAKKKNYTIQLDPDTFMYSDAKTDWESFVVQKARHYTTAPKYKVFKKLMLGIYSFTLVLMLLTFVLLCLQETWWIHACIGFGTVLVVKWWLLGVCFKRLLATGFIALLPFLDLLYAIGLPFFYYSTRQKTSQWK